MSRRQQVSSTKAIWRSTRRTNEQIIWEREHQCSTTISPLARWAASEILSKMTLVMLILRTWRGFWTRRIWMPILRGILPWRSTQNRTKVTRTVLYSHGCAVWPVIEGDDSTRFDYERIHKNGQVVRNELIDTARHGTTWHGSSIIIHHFTSSFHKPSQESMFVDSHFSILSSLIRGSGKISAIFVCGSWQ